jgi:hypothetical protein
MAGTGASARAAIAAPAKTIAFTLNSPCPAAAPAASASDKTPLARTQAARGEDRRNAPAMDAIYAVRVANHTENELDAEARLDDLL